MINCFNSWISRRSCAVSSVSSSRTAATLPASEVNTLTPLIIRNTPIPFPNGVTGVISPAPTLVMVATAHHRAVPRLSISLLLPRSASFRRMARHCRRNKAGCTRFDWKLFGDHDDFAGGFGFGKTQGTTDRLREAAQSSFRAVARKGKTRDRNVAGRDRRGRRTARLGCLPPVGPLAVCSIQVFNAPLDSTVAKLQCHPEALAPKRSTTTGHRETHPPHPPPKITPPESG